MWLCGCGKTLFPCVENWVFSVSHIAVHISNLFFFLYYIPFSASWFLFVQMFRFVAQLLWDGQLFSWLKRRLFVVFWAENIKWNLKMMASARALGLAFNGPRLDRLLAERRIFLLLWAGILMWAASNSKQKLRFKPVMFLLGFMKNTRYLWIYWRL